MSPDRRSLFTTPDSDAAADAGFATDPPGYPPDVTWFVLVSGSHTATIESEDDAPEWAEVQERDASGYRAHYDAGQGIPAPHLPESAWKVMYNQVVAVDDSGEPVYIPDRELTPEEKAVESFKTQLSERED